MRNNELEQLKSDLKNQKYELIIDLQNNPRSRRINSQLNALKLKFNKRNLEKLLLVYLKINKLKDAPPIPERYSDILGEFKLDDDGLDLFTDKIPSDLFKENQKYIGFCPGSRHFTKMWPKEYYIQLGNLLKTKDCIVVLFGGKDDKEICKEISSPNSGFN